MILTVHLLNVGQIHSAVLLRGAVLNYWLHAYSVPTVELKNMHKCSSHRTHLAQVSATYWR